MARPKKKITIDEYLKEYDKETLAKALESFTGSTGWELLKAYIEHEAAYHAGEALNLAQHSGTHCEGSSAAAKAEMCRHIAVTMAPEFIRALKGLNGVVETPRPEE